MTYLIQLSALGFLLFAASWMFFGPLVVAAEKARLSKIGTFFTICWLASIVVGGLLLFGALFLLAIKFTMGAP